MHIQQYLDKLKHVYKLRQLKLDHQDRSNLQHTHCYKDLDQHYHMFEDIAVHTAGKPFLLDTQ